MVKPFSTSTVNSAYLLLTVKALPTRVCTASNLTKTHNQKDFSYKNETHNQKHLMENSLEKDLLSF